MTHAIDAPQWQPTERDIAEARITDFARFVEQRTAASFTDYQSLWQWSVDDPAAFWGALWEYFELGDAPPTVLENKDMPRLMTARPDHMTAAPPPSVKP